MLPYSAAHSRWHTILSMSRHAHTAFLLNVLASPVSHCLTEPEVRVPNDHFHCVWIPQFAVALFKKAGVEVWFMHFVSPLSFKDQIGIAW